MGTISVIRTKWPRPQFTLTTLFAIVATASIPFALHVWREQAYQARLDALCLLTNTKHYIIGLRVESVDAVDARPDDSTYPCDHHLLTEAETLDRDDEVIRVNAHSDIAVANEEISAISCFPTLRCLELGGCQVSNASLARIAELHLLEWLVLDKTPVGDAGIANLGAMPSLRFLNLSRTRISDAAVEYLLRMRQLDTLFLGGTRITDEGFRRLAGHKSLRSLAVSDRITDAGLFYLSGFSRLEHVALYGSKRITTAGVARLKKLKPGLTGLWGERLWDPSQEESGGKPEWKRELDAFIETGSDRKENRNHLSP